MGMTETTGHLIAGEDIAANGDGIDVWNPNLGERLMQVPNGSAADVDAAVASARVAQREWWAKTPYERERVLRRIGDLIERDRERIARIESENTGKTLANALGDVDFAVEAFHFYAGHPTRAYG